MREIIFSTETGSDTPREIAEKYGIRIAPMHLVMGDVDYVRLAAHVSNR
ncbi:MAG: hypothetical protein LUD01_06980 [Clostridiales bacterium]|nr:hypothetical protein [Clostridiales bacterium]